jgi:hypothetical protein
MKLTGDIGRWYGDDIWFTGRIKTRFVWVIIGLKISLFLPPMVNPFFSRIKIEYLG